MGNKDDIVMAEYLLQEAHIAVVPGSAFYAPGHLRITYAASQAELKQAMDQMEEALEKTAQKKAEIQSSPSLTLCRPVY